ncbi:hypothetical protein FRC02_008409 [Tulasnella sp. 418]|nr:hypothetical protein FRC02_008409 [Tulasnella sp. 418]
MAKRVLSIWFLSTLIDFNPNVFTPGGKVDWLYNWGTTKLPIYNSIPNFYVMQWNGNGINQLASKTSAAGSSVILGFNEPDHPDQANMTPANAASLWKQYIQPIKAQNPNIKLISPAFTNGGSPMGFAWMDAFLAACTGCTFDAIALHWYGGWMDDFKEFINTAKKYNKPLWLTEFGLAWDAQAQAANYLEFLPLALAYLDSEPAVAKYAFFGAFYSGTGKDMLNSSGQLTDVGKLYIK